MNRQNTLIAVSILAFLAIPLAIWIITLVSQQGTVGVSMVVLPGDASVKINEKDYSNQDSIRLKPGTYTVTVSKEGFESSTQKLTAIDGRDTSFISLLTPISAEARRWATNNQAAYLEAEGKAGAIAAEEGQEFIDKYPLTKWLPLQKATYSIGYRDTEKGIVITIDALEGYREAALQDIRDLNIDPSDYIIEFTNHRNPFNE